MVAWYPDTPTRGCYEVSKRLSSKSIDRGYLGMGLEAKADDVVVLAMDWAVIMLSRQSS